MSWCDTGSILCSWNPILFSASFLINVSREITTEGGLGWDSSRRGRGKSLRGDLPAMSVTAISLYATLLHHPSQDRETGTGPCWRRRRRRQATDEEPKGSVKASLALLWRSKGISRKDESGWLHCGDGGWMTTQTVGRGRFCGSLSPRSTSTEAHCSSGPIVFVRFVHLYMNF